jgi:hypothetical protein
MWLGSSIFLFSLRTVYQSINQMENRKRKRRHIKAIVLLLLWRRSYRNPVVLRERLDVALHFERLIEEHQFDRYYGLSFSSFEKLLTYIAPALVVHQAQSMNRTKIKAMSPANQLQMTLSWLKGGR